MFTYEELYALQFTKGAGLTQIDLACNIFLALQTRIADMICVDLDYTLIDSEEFFEDQIGVAEGYGILAEEYTAAVEKLYQRYGAATYNFELLYETLAEKNPSLSREIIRDLNALLDKNYFFPDSKEFLASFEPKQLVLITSGNSNFQFRKIAAHDLRAHINFIWVISNKALAVGAEIISAARVGIKELFFFISDSPREIEAVKKAHPEVVCIQVRTPASWEIQRTTEHYDVHLLDMEAVTHYIKGMLSCQRLIR